MFASYIAAPLTLMLKISSSTNSSTSATQIVINYDRVDGSNGCSDGSDRKSASQNMSGPDMLCWYSGIYLTFIDDLSKSLTG